MSDTDLRAQLKAIRERAAQLLHDVEKVLRPPGKNERQKGRTCAKCGAPVRAKGLCARHYRAAWHKGEVGQHRQMERRW